MKREKRNTKNDRLARYVHTPGTSNRSSFLDESDQMNSD